MSAIGLKDRLFGFRVRASRESDRAASALDRGGADWQARWIMAFIAVGIAVRLIRYLLRFPLWCDETLLAINFLDRGYAGLMRPLECHQVAPLLFLWTELTAVKLLGFSEWSLRLFPLLCGLGSLLLFHRLARQLLRGTALVLAVGIFAVSYSAIRYASEVKPYEGDLMVSTLILYLTVRWWRQPERTRWLWALAAAMPIALGLSFPAVFVAGGASAAVAAVLIGESRRRISRRHMAAARGWMAWCVLNVAIAAGFVGWSWFGVRAQTQADLGLMASCWTDAFPPGGFMKLAAWLLRSHAGPLLAVPVGGDHWGSAGTLASCAVAALVLFRQGRYRLLLLCAGPLALNLIAAALRRYPYGGHMRLAMHVVPIASLLAGIGAAAVIEWLGRRRTGTNIEVVPSSSDGLQGPSYGSFSRLDLAVLRDQSATTARLRWPLAAALGLLMLLAVATAGRDFILPGKQLHDIRRRDFAVWFWGSLEREHEVANTLTELPPELPTLETPGRGLAAPQFLCNEWIYSPRHIHGTPCDMGRVSAARPLACVQYWSHYEPYDEPAFARWLAAMRQRYRLVNSARYTLLQDADDDRRPEAADRVEVYEFVPSDERGLRDCK